MLKPTMIVLTLFSVGRIFFGDFSMILAVIKGPTMEFVKVIDIYVYNMFKTVGSVGMGKVVAIGLYQSVFGFIVIVITNRLAKRFNDGSALF
jgi:multiple sugar transport system permease protein/putative aldouronate transport system permease protein